MYFLNWKAHSSWGVCCLFWWCMCLLPSPWWSWSTWPSHLQVCALIMCPGTVIPLNGSFLNALRSSDMQEQTQYYRYHIANKYIGDLVMAGETVFLVNTTEHCNGWSTTMRVYATRKPPTLSFTTLLSTGCSNNLCSSSVWRILCWYIQVCIHRHVICLCLISQVLQTGDLWFYHSHWLFLPGWT